MGFRFILRAACALLLTLKTLPADPAPRVQVDAVPRRLPDHFFGFDFKGVVTNAWLDPAWTDAVRGFHPEILRYPGGNHANHIDWRTGRLDGEFVHGKPPQRFGLYPFADFARACLATGARPLLCLNLLTSSLDEQLALIDEAARLGVDPAGVELGNELYWTRDAYSRVFCDGATFGRTSAKWLHNLSARHPNLPAGVPLWGQNIPRRPARLRAWDRQVLDTAPSECALVFHLYPVSGLDMESAPPGPDGVTARRAQLEKLRDPAQMQRLLAQPRATVERLRRQGSWPADRPWWITEYNLYAPDTALPGTWAHALFVSSLLMELLAEPRVAMALYYQLGHGLGSAIVYPSTQQRDEHLIPSSTVSAVGCALAWIASCAEGRRITYSLTADPDASSFLGRLFTGEGVTSRALLMNMGSQPLILDTQDTAIQNGSGTCLRALPWESVAEHDPLLRESIETRAGRLELPPYSLTRLEVKP